MLKISARAKSYNCSFNMMLYTNRYEDHNKAFFKLRLKRCNNQMIRCCVYKKHDSGHSYIVVIHNINTQLQCD